MKEITVKNFVREGEHEVELRPGQPKNQLEQEIFLRMLLQSGWKPEPQHRRGQSE